MLNQITIPCPYSEIENDSHMLTVEVKDNVVTFVSQGCDCNLTEYDWETAKQFALGVHGDRSKCSYKVPDVCSAQWTQQDWDYQCQNLDHKVK